MRSLEGIIAETEVCWILIETDLSDNSDYGILKTLKNNFCIRNI